MEHALRRWITKRDMKQGEFAEKAELSRQHVINILLGRRTGWVAALKVEKATDGAIKATSLVKQGRRTAV